MKNIRQCNNQIPEDFKKAQEILLRNCQELYGCLATISPDAIIITGKDLKIIMANQQAAELHGFGNPQEMIGKNVLKFIDVKDRQRAVENAKKTIEKGSLRNIEYKLLKSDGSSFLGEVSSSVISDEEGYPKAFIVIERDITESKKAQRQCELLNKRLISSNRKLIRSALIDPETGLFNHRYFEDIIEREFYRARRYNHNLSLIMLDIDYFKSINDVYGHQFGDSVLKQFTELLKKTIRRYDIAVRFSGEEFIIISPGSDRYTALNLCKRLLGVLNFYDFGDEKTKIKLKLSGAVVSYPEDDIVESMDLVKVSERILAKAKDDGGDRIYSILDIKKKKSKDLSLESFEKNNDVNFLKEKITKLTKRANRSIIEAVFAFAKTIKLKDNYTGEHTESTVRYAVELAKVMDLSISDQENIRQAAILHDLGKIGISEKILCKKSKLTRKEFEEIKRHPSIAVDIIRPIHFLQDLIPFILHHHERWDGKGYPNGLKRDNIPMGARIIALADSYHALISNRPYRKAYSKQEAVRIIREGAGSQFDPKIVDLFLKLLEHKRTQGGDLVGDNLTLAKDV